MNRFKIIILSAMALGTAGIGAAVAQTQDAPAPRAQAERPADPEITRADHRGDRQRRGHRGGMRGGEILRDIFRAADTDADGTVTPAEIEAYRSAQLAEVDTSGDGALSIEEFDTLYRGLTRSRMVDAFQALDADGDGQISPEEMDRRVERLIERMDRDGDGALTLRRPGPASPQE